jgi:hypothetical protein
MNVENAWKRGWPTPRYCTRDKANSVLPVQWKCPQFQQDEQNPFSMVEDDYWIHRVLSWAKGNLKSILFFILMV